MGTVILLAVIVLAIVAVFVWSRNGRQGSFEKPGAVSKPSKLRGNPAGHSGATIIRSLEAYWRYLVKSEYGIVKEYDSVEEADALVATQIEIIEVKRIDDTTAIAVVQSEGNFSDLPVWTRTLLLGTSVDLAQGVEARRRVSMEEVMEGPCPANMMIIFATYDEDDSGWQFSVGQEEQWGAKEEMYGDHVLVGESLQMQTDWKEAPFEITVLGSPEKVAEDMIQVPVRLTSLVPLWSIDSIRGFILAFLSGERDENGNYYYWASFHPNMPDNTFEKRVLVKGGSCDGHIFFWPDEDFEGVGLARNALAQPNDFVELSFLDGNDMSLTVDLTRSATARERVRFENGFPINPAQLPTLGRRLKVSYLADLEDFPVIGIGETATIGPFDGEPEFEIQALGAAESYGERTVRLPLRFTNRNEEAMGFSYFPLQLSTCPDTFGQIHHLWEYASDWRADQLEEELPDSLVNLSVEPGESGQANAYFMAPPEGYARPEEPFTLLWVHVDEHVWRPISLT